MGATTIGADHATGLWGQTSLRPLDRREYALRAAGQRHQGKVIRRRGLRGENPLGGDKLSYRPAITRESSYVHDRPLDRHISILNEYYAYRGWSEEGIDRK